jgi:tetratricopeptide (TPR) repeat protein
MGTPAIGPVSSYCAKCGAKFNAGDRFCKKCGTAASEPQAPPLSVQAPSAPRVVQGSKALEFERNIKVAWSCLQDVENKVNEIRQAKDAGDREVNEGTFRGTMAMSALQGRLEKEFQDGLEMAWKAAARASEINGNGCVEVGNVDVTPNLVFAGVSGLRGDLRFAFDKWDEAVAFYNQALHYTPGNPGCYYNIGAAYTNKHDPAAAIQAFQRVVEFDPIGTLGIEAAKNLEKLSSGTIGKKGFSGSWKVVAVLGGLTLFSLFAIGLNRGPGFTSLLFWGGILALYCWRKYK